MANTKNSNIRLVIVDKCLSKDRGCSTKEIMEACNKELEFYGERLITSMNTIREDIVFIENKWQVEVEQIQEGRNKYYRYKDRNFSIYKSPLTENELQQLNQTLLVLNRFKGMPQFEWISELNARFESTFMINAQTTPVIGFDENQYIKGQEYFSTIFEAITKRTVLKIQYKDFKSLEPYNYIIHPYFLKEYNNRWFLFGLNDTRQDLTNIALDRILSLETSKKDFQENTQYDFNEYFDDIIGVSLTKNREPEKVELFITNGLYPYIETKPLHGSQRVVSRNENGVVIQIEVIVNHELEQLIMSYGESMKVMKPYILESKIKERIKNSLENYIGSNSVNL